MKLILSLLLVFISVSSYSQEIVLKHKYYTNWYNTDKLIPDSIKYTLTKNLVNGDIKRTNKFVRDLLCNDSPTTYDYNNSGYDRGHMMSAADCIGDSVAMTECFYMTNITPQKPKFNRGIWKKSENKERTLTELESTDSVKVSIYTYYNNNSKTISSRKITVPDSLKKVMTVYPSMKTYIYVIPNKGSNKELKYFKL